MNNPDTVYDVFISYRRQGGSVPAKLIYETLKQKQYSVFLDHEAIRAGAFWDVIRKTIRTATDVVVVLSKGCLTGCNDPEDWLFREVTEAMKAKKNIFLVFSDDFQMPTLEEKAMLPKEIQKLLGLQGQTISVAHFDDFVKKVTNGLNAKPLPGGRAHIKETVAFLLDDGIYTLANHEKDALTRCLLAQYHGEKMANIMQDFANASFSHYKNIRLSFRYESEIARCFLFGEVPIDSKKYFKLEEKLSYKKLILKDSIETDFWVAFVRDLDKLDDWLKDETFLFSENLLIDQTDMQLLMGLSEKEQRDFFSKVMNTRLNVNGKVLQPVNLVFKETGIFANYRVENPLMTEEKRLLDLHLKFSIPHRKRSSYFFVSISDPTYSPHIHFEYPEDEIDVEMIPFMNRSTTAADAKIFDGLRELSFENEWVLPMSGAVFMITVRDEQK